MARPRQVADDEILEVARRCFLAHGPSVPTSRIAEEVGVSQAALFKRFGTKEELLLSALAPPGVPPWIALLEAGPDERPFRDQLEAVALELLGFFRQMTPCLSILRAGGVDLTEAMRRRYEVPPPILGQRAISGWFRRAMERGLVRELDPDAVSFVLLGSLQSRAFMQHVMGLQFPLRDAEAYIGEVVDVIWRGVAPVAEER